MQSAKTDTLVFAAFRGRRLSQATIAIVALVPALLLAQAGAPDQTTGYVLEMVTITSSAGENIVGSSSTVSLLDRKALDRFAVRNVTDALDGLAGMAVQRTYLKQRMLTSRGILQDIYANKNLVMIDGVPLWHAVSGEHNLDRVGVPELRRIEALKGPASVLYGSQAYTGAVNLVLRKVDVGDRVGEFYSGVGVGGAHEGGAQARLGFDNGLGLLVAANATRGQRHSFVFTDETGRAGNVTDYLDTSNLTVRATYKAHTLLLNRYDHREGVLGATPTFAQGAGGRQDVEGFAVAYKLKQNLGRDWSLEGLGFYDTRTIATGERARIGGFRSGGGLKTSYTVNPALTLTAGGDYEQRYGKEFSTYTATALANSIPGRSVWERSALGQFVWKQGAFNVVAGTRYSENALSGSSLTSRATGVYKLSDSRSVKLIAAQAFRSPSLVELYVNTNAIRGNPALKPETSDSLELAYVAQAGDRLLCEVCGQDLPRALRPQPGDQHLRQRHRVQRPGRGGGGALLQPHARRSVRQFRLDPRRRGRRRARHGRDRADQLQFQVCAEMECRRRLRPPLGRGFRLALRPLHARDRRPAPRRRPEHPDRRLPVARRLDRLRAQGRQGVGAPHGQRDECARGRRDLSRVFAPPHQCGAGRRGRGGVLPPRAFVLSARRRAPTRAVTGARRWHSDRPALVCLGSRIGITASGRGSRRCVVAAVRWAGEGG
jgi:hypothetical protein